MASYVAPSFNLEAFNCPFCGAFTHQIWSAGFTGQGSPKKLVPDTHFAYCMKCEHYSIWHQKHMIYPSGGNSPLPHPDLPEDIKEDYEEARSIVSLSPRSSTALLRLSIQKLTDKILGEKKKRNLNDNIKLLVANGLRLDVQKALDIVRVIGNNSVHPGQIDLKDNTETAAKLFALINIIAEQMITQPREISALYNNLPDEEIQRIKKRNENKVTEKNNN